MLEKSGANERPTSHNQNTIISSMITVNNADHHEYLHLAGSFVHNSERQMVFPVIVYWFPNAQGHWVQTSWESSKSFLQNNLQYENDILKH